MARQSKIELGQKRSMGSLRDEIDCGNNFCLLTDAISAKSRCPAEGRVGHSRLVQSLVPYGRWLLLQ